MAVPRSIMQRNPVMIFAGSFWSGATENGLANGFRTLGWAVQEIDNRDFQINPGRHLGLRLAARVFGKNMVKNYQNRILENCRVLKPDVFLTVKGIGITPDLLRQIRALGVCTMMYYPDVAFNHRGVSVESFNEYDLFITTKTFQLEYLENMLGSEHVTYVPHGYSSSVHRPVFDCTSEESYHIDLLYSGNHSPYKQRWLEETLAILPEEISVEIVGNRWARHGSAGVLARCGMPGAQMGVAYARAIQTARINIAIHFGPTASGWEDLVSTRTFEIPACKGFMLHIDNDEVREFFKPGEEIDVFSTPEELADKVRFYLARPELRAQMIERAYARCVPAYSYAARAKLMADIVATKQWTT
ncbi:glycosyltransferase [Aquamicrobium segne]|uniref:Glycosyltransferase n=1 Tax=Aquamicrobium segne TaxID=469547 RepID=A0ABW0GUD8_9HYPH